jgi:hypothetical protein
MGGGTAQPVVPILALLLFIVCAAIIMGVYGPGGGKYCAGGTTGKGPVVEVTYSGVVVTMG